MKFRGYFSDRAGPKATAYQQEKNIEELQKAMESGDQKKVDEVLHKIEKTNARLNLQAKCNLSPLQKLTELSWFGS